MSSKNLFLAIFLAFAIALMLPLLGDMASQGRVENFNGPVAWLYKLVLSPDANAQAPAQARAFCGVMHRIGKTAVFVVSSDPDVTTKEGCEKDTYWKKTIWLDDATVKAIYSKEAELARKSPEIVSGAKAIGDTERNEAAASFCKSEFNKGSKCVHLYDYDPTADAERKQK